SLIPLAFTLTFYFFFFSSRRRHTRFSRDWSSDVCSSDLSSGVGAPPHLAGVLFQERTGTKLHHIPFRGDADANTAVLAGHVNMIFGSMGPTVPHIRCGKVRALAVTGNTRSAALPDVPTLEEAGVPDYNGSTWWGLLAPARTPPAIRDKL